MSAKRKSIKIRYDDPFVSINGHHIKHSHLEMSENIGQRPTLVLAAYATADGPEFDFSVGAFYDVKVTMNSGRIVWDRNMSLIHRGTADGTDKLTTVWLHFE